MKVGSSEDIGAFEARSALWKVRTRPFRSGTATGGKVVRSEVEGPRDDRDREHCLEQVQCGEQEAPSVSVCGVRTFDMPSSISKGDINQQPLRDVNW